MNIETEIYLNKLSQNIVSLEEGVNWFNLLTNDAQMEILVGIVFFILQAGACGKDVNAAIVESKLKPTYTPCHLLLKAQEKEPKGNRLLGMQLAKVINLPNNEREKSFKLLISLFKIADRNKRKKIFDPNKYWWHRDLSDEKVIQQILSEYGR